MKRFVDLADFTRDEVLSLLDLARRLEKQPEPRALLRRQHQFGRAQVGAQLSFRARADDRGLNAGIVTPSASAS